MKKILIMAGGTGGHIFPALAVAQFLMEQGVKVHWLGTRTGIEKQYVSLARIPISFISINGLRGNGLKKWLLSPFLMMRAISQARKIIKREKPDVVLGMGGFASGPGGIAAWTLRKPLVIHEQNTIPGLTNRTLAALATRVLQAFPDTFLKKRRPVTTGNPVRLEISQLPEPKDRSVGKNQPLHLLVLGGSQGATILNQVLPAALSLITPKDRPEIWHQTGKLNYEETRQMYLVQDLKARIDGFIEDMKSAYEWADLVLCRAGALTVTELAAVGLGSILVPYPHATDNHQLHNAAFLVNAHAAIIIPQNELSPMQLSDLLLKLTKEKEVLLMMATAARQLFRKDATEKVVENCLRAADKLSTQKNLLAEKSQSLTNSVPNKKNITVEK